MELIIASVIAFTSTNIDDIFVLMFLFGNRSYNTRQVVVGQYIGITALIAISFAGSFANLFIKGSYIGLLGLLPIFIGIRALILHFYKAKQEGVANDVVTRGKGSVWAVAAITFANGGDNIGIYIPLFATLSLTAKFGMVIIFLLMTALWCWIGKYLSKHPVVARALDRYGHILTPIILIMLGLYILYESGSFELIR